MRETIFWPSYGRKGGEGPTAGRKAETLRSPSTGLTKRVFNGQRWLVVAQMDEESVCYLTAFPDQATAERVSAGCYRLGYMVHYVERADVLTPGK